MKDLSKHYYGFGYDILDEVLDWINDNLSPEDVFTIAQLKEWAVENASSWFDPDEIFTVHELGKWALEYGFVEEE